MTVTDHPTRSDAIARGDLAESLVTPASEFAFLVRTEGREAIGAWLDGQGIYEPRARALLVVVAAGWPVDATNEDTLRWISWDEFGETLDGTLPLFPPAGEDADPVPLHCLETPAVAAAIKEGRLKARLSRRELAEAAGVGERTVAKWENRERRPGMKTWDRLQDVLGPLGTGQEQQRREDACDAA